jgi:hypothetical protein
VACAGIERVRRRLWFVRVCEGLVLVRLEGEEDSEEAEVEERRLRKKSRIVLGYWSGACDWR